MEKLNHDSIFHPSSKTYKDSYLLSDYLTQQEDLKYLLRKKDLSSSEVLRRILKLACSKDLSNAEVIAVGNKNGLKFLIETIKKDKTYIIDYQENIVTEKENFFKKCRSKELSRVSRSDLYKIYYMTTEEEPNLMTLISYLLFTDELINEIGTTDYEFLNGEYDEAGINKNNYFLIGNYADSLFFEESDYDINPLVRKIDDFTRSPDILKNVSYNHEKNCYVYQDEKETIPFKLLSDELKVTDNDLKNNLLTKKRYGYCHSNSIEVLFRLSKENNKKTNLVNGLIKINESDYIYHTWLEVEYEKDKQIIIDYNHNLVTSKKEYDKLFTTKVINKTNYEELKELLFLLNTYKLNVTAQFCGTFSQELIKDLNKNSFLLKQKGTK